MSWLLPLVVRPSYEGGVFNSRVADHRGLHAVIPAKAGIHSAVAVAIASSFRRKPESSVFAWAVAFENQKRFVRYAAEFISFGKPQKKRTKEKRFPRRSNPIASLLSGFFDSPSMARSKNGAHPVRRPPGPHKLLAFRI